jgi:sulfite reductase (ferredoxin)
VFDRYGERVSRHKARIKYLINKIGVEAFLNLIKEEEKALLNKTVEIDLDTVKVLPQLKKTLPFERPLIESEQFVKWLKTNTFKQKQKGYHGVYVKIQLGNISSSKTRDLIQVIEQFALSSDVRLTINQGVLLKYVSTEELPFLFEALNKLNLASVGFDSVADITACPGTDTCNLAISNSTNISVKLEEVIYNEFPDLIYDRDIKIKISGCMNSCGQHGLAQIGFHGSSFKVGTNVVPALQVLLGGGTLGDGKGRIAEKVIKVASKRAPDVLRSLFNDFEKNASDGEYFNSYYDRKGKDYFYQLLKPIGDNSNLTEDEFYDWGSEERFKTEIGVGECAGVIIDLVQTLFFEAEEKLAWSAEAFDNKQFGDSIYYSYAAFIHAAKGLLLNGGFHVNTHHALINDFEKQFVETGSFVSFKELVLQINKNEPSEEFAAKYFNEAKLFLNEVKAYREKISANTFETVK